MKKNVKPNPLMQSYRKVIIALFAGLICSFSVTNLSAQKMKVPGNVKNRSGEAVQGITSTPGSGKQMLDQTPTRVQTGLNPGFEKIGTLKPKSIKEIETSMWSLGCETLDRNLASWDNYKEYIGPLGIKHIRLQGGWERTEKIKGKYNFAWLDSLVNDAHALGLKVCLETSYINRLYDKKATNGPGGPLPEDKEVLKAWDEWVKAMAQRYSRMGVTDWMMFNEPNLRKNNTVEIVTAFNIRTAEIIKNVDPDARIGGLVLAGPDTVFIEGFLKLLKEQKKENLFYWLIYHGYGKNPDEINIKVDSIWKLTAEYAPHLKLWQGEAGCASEEAPYALSGIDWTELSHAKWNARRMLGDLGHNVMSSVFTISDLSYRKDFIARYGLLKTNPDNSIIKVKTAYYVVQNVVSVFNDAVELNPGYNMSIAYDKELSWYAFKDKKTGLDLITFWDGTDVPSNDINLGKASFLIKNGNLNEPVWVDLITGNIYKIPAEQVISNGNVYVFNGIPVYDGPSVITDKSLLDFVPSRKKK